MLMTLETEAVDKNWCNFKLMNEDFKYRTATNKDTDKITSLVKSILPEFNLDFDAEGSEKDLSDIEKTYTNNGGTFIVIENGQNEIVGSIALLRLDSNNCKLRKLYIAKDFRRLNLGSRLLDQALQRASELNFKTIYLETVHTMTAAIHLYRKLGFSIIEDRIAASPRCDIVMVKSIENLH